MPSNVIPRSIGDLTRPFLSLGTHTDLIEKALKQRGYEIVCEYSDKIPGAKQKRPGLDQLLADARRRKFDVVLVWAFDRVARSVRHFLEILDELNHLSIEFVSFRENIDTGGPLGRAMIVIVGESQNLKRISSSSGFEQE